MPLKRLPDKLTCVRLRIMSMPSSELTALPSAFRVCRCLRQLRCVNESIWLPLMSSSSRCNRFPNDAIDVRRFRATLSTRTGLEMPVR